MGEHFPNSRWAWFAWAWLYALVIPGAICAYLVTQTGAPIESLYASMAKYFGFTFLAAMSLALWNSMANGLECLAAILAVLLVPLLWPIIPAYLLLATGRKAVSDLFGKGEVLK